MSMLATELTTEKIIDLYLWGNEKAPTPNKIAVVKQNQIQGLIDAQNSRSARFMNFMELEDDITINTFLQDSLFAYEQVKQVSMDPSISQELHSLISAIATFDSASNDRDFMVTNDSSLTQLLLTSSY